MTMIKMEMGSPPLLLLAPPPVVSMSTSILLMGPTNNEKRKKIRYVPGNFNAVVIVIFYKKDSKQISKHSLRKTLLKI